MFADAGISGSVNILATTTTAPQLTTALEAGEADAAIVWKENVKGDQVEIAEVEGIDKYIKVIPAASLNTTQGDETLKIFEAVSYTHLGGGGTDFNAAVNAFTLRVDNRIIFTDGQAPMPDKPMNAIWVVYGDEEIAPDGGTVIRISPEQDVYKRQA